MDKFKIRATIKNTSFLSTFIDKNSDGKKKLSIRAKRYMSVISIHLCFFLSFYLDIQVLEGTLNASRFLGFHLIDVYTTIEVYIATYHLPINMIIGTITVVLVYLLIGGRSYCSWVCPYGILSEIAEKLNNILVNKKIVKERVFNKDIKYVFWLMFLIMSFTSGYIVFETINIVGILSRAIVYGYSIALIWVALVFALEVFYSRRAWCKYICPVGTTYGAIGFVSATKIQWNDNCDHCMVCHDACFENHVLELTKAKYDKQRQEEGIKTQYVTSGDCTLCGRCIDVCHSDALKIEFRLKEIL